MNDGYNIFGVLQQHISKKSLYNYLPSREARTNGMIKNTKWLNSGNWGKTMIGLRNNLR